MSTKQARVTSAKASPGSEHSSVDAGCSTSPTAGTAHTLSVRRWSGVAHRPEDWEATRPDAPFTFVADVEPAIAKVKEIAGDKNVAAVGPNVIPSVAGFFALHSVCPDEALGLPRPHRAAQQARKGGESLRGWDDFRPCEDKVAALGAQDA